MRLLQLVKSRGENLPEDDVEFGRAILQMVDELSVALHNLICCVNFLKTPMKKLPYSGLDNKHWQILINTGMIKLAGQIIFNKEAIPLIENDSFEETLESMLDNAARTVIYPHWAYMLTDQLE